jgi:hypothetical protein
MIDERALNKPLIGVALIVVLGAVGGWYYWHVHSAAAPASNVAQTSPAQPAAATEAKIEHPLPAPAGDAPKSPLPALEDSDAPFGEALATAAGTPIGQFLVPESLIRHIVVSVDNLSRQKVAVDKRPIAPAGGLFIVDGDELHATVDEQNYRRYAPMIDALKKVDTQRLMAVYQHFYPLFQKAYQDLGYPNGYFNDRLVQVIDVLLATPQLKDPIELVRPNVMYVFADPALEARPAGQKLLLRMGPDNASAVKAKLTEFRALIIAAPKPAV